MNARLRRFLLMLLVLILPLQAFASVAMLGCMVAHPAESEHSAMPEETTAGCHTTSGQSDAPSPSHDCKHCAACVLAATVAVPVAESLSVMPLAVRFLSQPDAEFSGFIADGPERPPRPFLA